MNYLVVGLGNIGAEYASTRHNMGFMVLDAWAQASNLLFETRRYGSVAECSFKGRKFILLKPSTYMNLSGSAVRYWMHKMNVPTERLIVICDDLNLPFGTVRMRRQGSDGGHNGLRDIQDALGTQEYTRIRIGIGNGFARGGQVDFVLGEMDEEQKQKVRELSVDIIAGIKEYATGGPERAMNFLNAKKS
jgi:PTH1 family peptidyl-tRNA hydrolase